MAHMVKNLPAMRKIWVWYLGWEDPLEEAWQPTPVFLPGESPWTEEPGRLRSMGLQRVRHDWATKHIARRWEHFYRGKREVGRSLVNKLWLFTGCESLPRQKSFFSFWVLLPLQGLRAPSSGLLTRFNWGFLLLIFYTSWYELVPVHQRDCQMSPVGCCGISKSLCPQLTPFICFSPSLLLFSD